MVWMLYELTDAFSGSWVRLKSFRSDSEKAINLCGSEYEIGESNWHIGECCPDIVTVADSNCLCLFSMDGWEPMNGPEYFYFGGLSPLSPQSCFFFLVGNGELEADAEPRVHLARGAGSEGPCLSGIRPGFEAESKELVVDAKDTIGAISALVTRAA